MDGKSPAVDRPVRVLHLRDSPWVDGPGRTILETATRLDAKQVEYHVGVFAADPQSEHPLAKALKSRGVSTHVIADRRGISLAQVRSIVALMRDLRIDVLHTSEFRSNVLALLCRLHRPVRLVTTVHGWIANDLRGRIFRAVDKMMLPLFDAVLLRPAVTRSPRVLATARLRRAPCLVSAGRFDEATADVNGAFAVVAGDDADLRVDIAMAHVALGRIALLSFDPEHATAEFEAARALLHPDEQYEVLTWLVQSTMFDAGEAAIGYADQLMALVGQSKDKPDRPKNVIAGARTLHARALLNHGQVAAAYAELKRALKEQGGLTMTVSLDDVETRADLALAALLNDDQLSAQKYMAYTGAGRFDKSPFASAQGMSPPPCGGPAGLRPDDMAVVEFGVDDDGRVIHVVPIYASRTGPVAAEFARSVAGWSWKPEDARQIPAFFRRVTRVELRCVTTAEHPDVLEILRGDLSAFLADRHIAPARPDAMQVPGGLLDESNRRPERSAEQELAAVPAMLSSSVDPRVPREQQLRWLARARDVLAAAGAPVAVQTYVDVRRSAQQARYGGSYVRHRAYLRSLLAGPGVGADARVADTLRILIAEAHYGLREPADAGDLLMQVAADPALPENDPPLTEPLKVEKLSTSRRKPLKALRGARLTSSWVGGVTP